MLAGTTNLRRLDQVEHFWDTVDTIGEGFGFSLFGARHLVTLALYIGFAALSCKLYKAADGKKRAQLRGLFAVLLLADEAFKQIGLQIGGNFSWDYLPLHLCSINIFLIALYAWKPSRLLDNFLYFICIPAATAALLFPTWTSLPAVNFMFWHSTSVHILLAAYLPSCCFRAVISDRASGTWASASCCCWRWRCRFIASTCCSIRISCF